MDSKIIGVRVRKESLREDIFRIYSQLFSSPTDCSGLEFEELSGGYVNNITKVSPKSGEKSATVVVFRTFDLKLDFGELFAKADDETSLDASSFFNRSSEFDVMNALSEHGLCARGRLSVSGFFFDLFWFLSGSSSIFLLDSFEKIPLCQSNLFSNLLSSLIPLLHLVCAAYENGICYGYSCGEPVNAYLMLSDEFLDEMTVKLAKLHSLALELPETKFETYFHKLTVPGQLNEMQRQLDEQIEAIDAEPYRSFPKISDLFDEEQRILSKLRQLGFGRPTLCHNDLNQKNIIYNKEGSLGSRLSLIDFELVMKNYPAMELGYLFTSYAGHFLDSYNKKFFPTKEYRLRFLSAYLRERTRLSATETANETADESKSDYKTNHKFQDELKVLHIRTNLFILYCLLFQVKELPLLDVREELKTGELAKVSKGNRYYYGQIAFNAWEIFEENRSEFMKLADDYLARKIDDDL